MRKENASDDNIERVLLIFNLLISGSGKHAYFRGKYCYLGAPIGTLGSQIAYMWPLALGEVG